MIESKIMEKCYDHGIVNLSRKAASTMNAPVIEACQDHIRRVLRAVVPSRSEYAILEFPNHPNVGDSAIYLGELEFCRAHFKSDPVAVFEAKSSDIERISSLDSKVALFLHGGGNFGDTYPRHQWFREEVLRRFPKRKIVSFPQSIYFNDSKKAATIADAISKHGDFTLLVRDRESFEFARNNFDCSCEMVPDMAFMLGAIEPPRAPRYSTIALMRTDRESVFDGSDCLECLPTSARRLDWLEERLGREYGIGKLPRKIRAILPSFIQWKNPVSPASYERLALVRFRRGCEILSDGRLVLTDRLHAHILCILLGIPHVVLDNNYAKMKKFDDVWIHDAAYVREGSLDAAIDLLLSI